MRWSRGGTGWFVESVSVIGMMSLVEAGGPRWQLYLMPWRCRGVVVEVVVWMVQITTVRSFEVLYGGRGRAWNAKQNASRSCLEMDYVRQQLGLPALQPQLQRHGEKKHVGIILTLDINNTEFKQLAAQ